METVNSNSVTRQILQIIPLAMRTVASELRQTGHLPTPSQFSVLVLLHDHSANLSELADFQGVSLPTMSSTISTLEGQGWVERRRSQVDRRIVETHLTEKGRRKLSRINQAAIKRLEPVVGQLAADDLAVLAAGLHVLRNIFDIIEISEE